MNDRFRIEYGYNDLVLSFNEKWMCDTLIYVDKYDNVRSGSKCCFKVLDGETENLSFYSRKELSNLVESSKSSVELAGRQLAIGDFVVGINSLLSLRYLYYGIYLGRKQIYIGKSYGNKTKVSCQLVYKIEDAFKTEEEKLLNNNLIQEYQLLQQETFKNKSKPLIFDYNNGDILFNTQDNVTLYLGEKYINDTPHYVYLNFKIKTLAQQRFYEFLCGKETCDISIYKSIILTNLNIEDMTLSSVIKMILNGLGGSLVSYKTKKGYYNYLTHIDLNKFIDSDYFLNDIKGV